MLEGSTQSPRALSNYTHRPDTRRIPNARAVFSLRFIASDSLDRRVLHERSGWCEMHPYLFSRIILIRVHAFHAA